MVRLRAFGTYTMRVTDPAKFLTEIVGTDGEFTTEEIEFQIRNIIVTHFSQIIATCGIPVLDMAANTIDLAKIVHDRIAPMVAEYGLELPAFYIENISLPAEVEAALDKRTATGVAGDLSKYTEFSAAEAMTKAAANPGGGGGIGAGLGAGMGMAMAERMARSGPWGARPRRRPPTAAAAAAGAEKRWHVAVDGEATGPFTRDELGRMVAERHASTARQLALDAGRAGLAARPRRGRARRPLQRAAAAARRLRCTPMELGPVAGGAAPPEQHRFPCPTCGVGPALRPGTGQLKCAHCGHEEAIPSAARRRSPSSTCARSSATRLPAGGDAGGPRRAVPELRRADRVRRRRARPRMPVLRLADRHRHRRQPPDQAAGAAAVPARRGPRRGRR